MQYRLDEDEVEGPVCERQPARIHVRRRREARQHHLCEPEALEQIPLVLPCTDGEHAITAAQRAVTQEAREEEARAARSIAELR